jgi:hypothetical protein
MPDMRAPLRGIGRRVTGQVIKQVVVDGEAKQEGQNLLRASVVLTPLDPREILIKPEGQRKWKWWKASSAVELNIGWFLIPDHDHLIKYEIMTLADWGQARVYLYDFVETPRELAP